MTLMITPLPDGTVRIGSVPLAAAYIAEVHLPGVTVLIDPSDPEPTSHAVVYEPEVAQETVATLFGTDAAEALSRGVAAAVPEIDSPELKRLTHLGWLTWLDRYRPVPLDLGLLDLERTVTRAEFPDDEPELSEPAQVAAVVDAARHLRENPAAPLAGKLRDLLRSAFLQLPASDADRPEVAHERDLLQLADEWGSAAVDSADLTWLAEQLTPVPAVNLGGGHRAIVGGASLDWRRVPRQLLPAPEESVWFEVAIDHVEVTIAAPPSARPHPAFAAPPHSALAPPSHPASAPPSHPASAAPPHPASAAPPHPAFASVADLPARLAASLRSSDWPLPLAEGELAFDPASGGWRGDLPIVPAAVQLAARAGALDMDVRSQALTWVAPNQRRAREAAARRWASRGLVAQRLARAGDDDPALAAAASAALRFAARLWRAAGERDRAERCVALAGAPLLAAPTRLSLAEQWLLTSRGAH